MGKSPNAAKSLLQIRKALKKQFILRFPSSIFIKAKDPTKPAIRYFILLFGYVPSLIGRPFYNKLIEKRDQEWDTQNQEKNGSEMYLFFARR
jgi:hypothetical protein